MFSSLRAGPARRRLATFAVLTAAAALWAPHPATAAESRSVAPEQEEQLLGGILGGASAVLCPLTGGEGNNPLCHLDALHIRFHTKFKRADGSISTRSYGTLINVPTLLELNGDGLPDVLATASLTSLSSARVDIVKLPLTAPANLPASIEAIVADPTGSLPRDRIAYGVDALESKLPNVFTSTISVGSTPAGDTRLKVNNSVQQPGASLKLLAGLFDGTPTDRDDVVGGALRYTPVPATFGADLTIGERFAGILTGAVPTTLDIDVASNEGDETKSFSGRIDKLPTRLEVSFDKGGEDVRTVSAIGTTPITSLEGVFADGEDERIEAKVSSLPTKLLVQQTGARKASVSTLGTGPVGQVRFGLANGAPKYLSTDEGYIHAFEEGGRKSLSAQINGLKSAAFDGGSPITLDAQFQTPAANPIRVLLHDEERNVDARIDDVPDHVAATIDLDGGTITYDGHGQTVGELTLDATNDAPFFERATHIEGTLRNLPANVNIAFKPGQDKSATLTASAPIGSIEVTASDGDGELPPGDRAGVVYRDTPSRYTVGGRANGLQTLHFKGGDKHEANVKLAPGDFSIVFDDGNRTLDALVTGLPGELAATIDTAAGRTEYHGSATVPKITAQYGKRSKPLAGKIHNVSVTLYDVPQDLVVTDSTPAFGGTEVTSTPAIPKIELAASSDDVFLEVPGTESGANVDTRGGKLRAAVRVRNLQKVVYSDGDGKDVLSLRTTAPQKFNYEVIGDLPGIVVPEVLSGTIDQVPTELDVTVLLGKIEYRASDPIGSLSLHARNFSAISGKDMSIELTDLPREIDLHTHEPVSNDVVDSIGFDARGGSIGSANINLADEMAIPQDNLFGGADQVDLDNRAGTKVRAHLHDVRRVMVSEFATLARMKLEAKLSGDLPMVVTAQAVDSKASVRIPDPPSDMEAILATAERTDIHLKTNAVIPVVKLDIRSGAPVWTDTESGRGKLFFGDLVNVPTDTRVCIGEDPWCLSGFPIRNGESLAFDSEVVHVATNGPDASAANAFGLTGRLCMGFKQLVNLNSGTCANDALATKYIDIANMRVKDVQFETSEGSNSNAFYDDDGGIVGVRLRTSGLRMDHFRFVDKDIPLIDGVQLKPGTSPIVSDRWFAIDTEQVGIDHPVLKEVQGSSVCPTGTALNMLARSDETGSLGVMTFGGGQLSNFAGSLLGC